MDHFRSLPPLPLSLDHGKASIQRRARDPLNLGPEELSPKPSAWRRQAKSSPRNGESQKLLRRAQSLSSRPASDIAFVISVARSLQRAVSGQGLTTPMSTTLCQICFENVPTADTIQLSACRHRFCAPCLKQYLELKIKDGNVFPVCFHPVQESSDTNSAVTTKTTTCGKRLEDAQLQSIVDREVWAKCTLFRFNKANATARECPFCAHPQQCAGPEEPACSCEQCGREFCFFHGNAHVDGTCADYELKHAESETQTRATIARVAKPCPGCKSNVEKSGGCNHMTCVVCHTEFCWLCSERLVRDAITDHYSTRNLSGCEGRQFDIVDIDGREALWARLFRLNHTMHLQYARRLYQVAYLLAYPPAVLLVGALRFLIAGVRRVRPVQAASATVFSSLIKFTRISTAGIATFAAIVATYKMMPASVFKVFMYIQAVVLYGEIGREIWPLFVSRSRAAWGYMRPRTSG